MSHRQLFVNVRGSCSDDLERKAIAEKAIHVWIKHSARTQHRHYHSVRPEDWAAVTGKAAPHPAPSTPVRGHQEPSTLHHAREQSLDVAKDAENQYPRQGSNKRGLTRGKPEKGKSLGAQSGTTKRGGRRGRLKLAKKFKRAHGRKGGA